MRALLTILILLSAFSFLFAASSASVYAPSNITYTGNYSACLGWTAYQASKSTNYAVRDEMGYARNCHNVTYTSYCHSAPVIDFNISRQYWDIDCTGSDYCTGWTRFYVEKSTNFTERDPATNLSRVCTTYTYVAWCVKTRSIVDYTIGHRYSELNCSDWQQTCGFSPAGARKRVESGQSGYCRNCVDTTYRYYCNASGRISWGASQIQSACGNWSACPTNPFNYSSAAASGGSSVDVSNPPMVAAMVLVGVVLTAILILVFSRHKD